MKTSENFATAVTESVIPAYGVLLATLNTQSMLTT